MAGRSPVVLKVLGAGFGVALAVGVIAQRMEMNDFRTDLDYVEYVVAPFTVPNPVVAVLAGVGTAIFVACVRALWPFARASLWIATALAVSTGAGLVLAACYWVITIPTQDANIGAGLAVMLGLPFVVMLLGVAVSLVWTGTRPEAARKR